VEIRGDAGGQRRSVCQGGFVQGAIRAVSRRCSVKLPCDPSTSGNAALKRRREEGMGTFGFFTGRPQCLSGWPVELDGGRPR